MSDSLHTQHTLLENDTKHMDEMKEHFKEQQRLVSEMNLLHREVFLLTEICLMIYHQIKLQTECYFPFNNMKLSI